MVEREPDAVRQLRTNIARLQAEGASVVPMDAAEYLAGRPRAFDIVFLDPPFAAAEHMVRHCAERLTDGWLAPGALAYIEAPRQLDPLPLPETWQPVKSGSAGKVRYGLFRVTA